jgi:hypothetical protein
MNNCVMIPHLQADNHHPVPCCRDEGAAVSTRALRGGARDAPQWHMCTIGQDWQTVGKPYPG